MQKSLWQISNFRTDAFCTVNVENGSIEKFFVIVILNKSAYTLIHIIADRVISGVTIYPDEIKDKPT